MPTLSEVQEHAADAEHQAFQRAYDALLNVAKDPITCRHFWDAGFTAGQADANDMLTVAHMDGYSKGREATRRELEGQEAVAFRCRVGGPGPWTYVDHRAPDSFELRECEIQNLHLGPPPDVRELVEAADAVVRRWDSPLWSQQGHTGDFIARLRAALAKFGGGI